MSESARETDDAGMYRIRGDRTATNELLESAYPAFWCSVTPGHNPMPLEGVTSSGMIRTAANRNRVPALFQSVVDAAVVVVGATAHDASLYLYGSVATGTARKGKSDVDLLTVGIAAEEAAHIERALSLQFSDLCRGVEIAVAQPSDFLGESDEAYGGRVFLRHYCVHLAGPDLHSCLPDFPADVRAARGFNGDIAQHARRWLSELEKGADPVRLSRQIARKTLLATTGLVSVHDATWTTNRTASAERWAAIKPALAGDLRILLSWAGGDAAPDRSAVEGILNGVVLQIVASFETMIGLWSSEDRD
jgi:uncharacterized protein